MAITFRQSGNPITHAALDTNFASFFLSASYNFSTGYITFYTSGSNGTVNSSSLALSASMGDREWNGEYTGDANISGKLTVGNVNLGNISSGNGNTVLVLNSTNDVVTGEIDSRVWGSSLVDISVTPTSGDIPYFTDSNTLSTSSMQWNTTDTSLDVDGAIVIKQVSNTYANGLIISSSTPYSAGSDAWEIFNQGNSSFDKLQFSTGGTARGYLNPQQADSQLNFTGQHRVTSQNSNLQISASSYVGLIVDADGTYQNTDNSLYPTINESLPNVEICTTVKSKKVFGVISDKEDLNDNGDTSYSFGIFNTVVNRPSESIARIVINSLGEGGIWVCNKNGDLENGDYICSSGVEGLGMRQDEYQLCNFTVAKITQDCNFDNPADYIEFNYNGNIYKKQFVGCTYHCG